MEFMSLRFSRKKKETRRQDAWRRKEYDVCGSPKASVNRRERITEWKGTKNNGNPKNLEKKVSLYKLDKIRYTYRYPLQREI